MMYTVKQLAKIAGVSAYYDEIGLLPASAVGEMAIAMMQKRLCCGFRKSCLLEIGLWTPLRKAQGNCL
jgi:hypothetical protein